MSLQSWLERRRRKVLTRWRATIAPLPRPPRPLLCLFCDFEGHHAGEHAGRAADAGTDILLGLLDCLGLRITFNVVADLCRTHPDRVRRVIQAGHDIACHGWRHERPRDLSPPAVEQMLSQAIAAFEGLGVRPTGFRSPESAWSCRLVRELPRLGFLWNAERDPASRPYRIRRDLVRLPVRTDDWDLTESGSSVATLLAKWESAVQEAALDRGVLCIGVHEWLFAARPAFAEALELALQNWRTRDRLVFQTLSEAAWVRSEAAEQSGP